MRNLCKLLTGLCLAAFVILGSKQMALTVDATNYIMAIGDDNNWYYGQGDDYSKIENWTTADYLMSRLKDGDKLNILGAGNSATLKTGARLGFLSYYQTSGLVLYTGGIDELVISNKTEVAVHGNVSKAAVFPGCSVTFYDNIDTLIILYENDPGEATQIVNCGGTVSKLVYQDYKGNISKQYYNFTKGKLDVVYGCLETASRYYSLTPVESTTTATQKTSAPAASLEYYAPVFNVNYYYSHYPDLQSAIGNNAQALLAHFISNGMKEGRQGCDSFDVYAYQNRYADLQKVYGQDLVAYYLHYINNGKAEGRIGD